MARGDHCGGVCCVLCVVGCLLVVLRALGVVGKNDLPLVSHKGFKLKLHM